MFFHGNGGLDTKTNGLPPCAEEADRRYYGRLSTRTKGLAREDGAVSGITLASHSPPHIVACAAKDCGAFQRRTETLRRVDCAISTLRVQYDNEKYNPKGGDPAWTRKKLAD